MTIKKVLITSVVIWIIGTVFAWITCGNLFQWVYQIEPTSLWKSPSEMMSSTNMLGLGFAGLIIAIMFVSVYTFIYKGISGEGVKRGMTYGFYVWLIGSTGMATLPFYMNIDTTVVIYWITQALVLNAINGAIVGAMISK